MVFLWSTYIFKGTVIDFPFKVGNVWFKRIPWKLYLVEVKFKLEIYIFNYFQLWFLYKSDLRIKLQENNGGTIRIKHNNDKYLLQPWSINCVKGTVVNRALPSLHEGSLKIMPKVPKLSFLIRICTGINKLNFKWPSVYNITRKPVAILETW